MNADIFIITLIIGYFIGGYHLIKFIRHRLPSYNKFLNLIIISFFYALFFGLGVLGGDADPGFAFPFPIVWTGLIYVWQWGKWILFINGVIIPLIFWWIVILVFMVIKQQIQKSLLKSI